MAISQFSLGWNTTHSILDAEETRSLITCNGGAPSPGISQSHRNRKSLPIWDTGQTLCLLGINSVLGGNGEETDVLTDGRKVSRGMEIQLGVERRQLLLIPSGWVTP